MAVIHANVIKQYLEELDRYYIELRSTVEGTPVSENWARHYSSRPEEPEPFVDVDINRLTDKIGHFKVSVDALKRLKAHSRKMLR